VPICLGIGNPVRVERDKWMCDSDLTIERDAMEMSGSEAKNAERSFSEGIRRD
jgi:hypothetical protein